MKVTRLIISALLLFGCSSGTSTNLTNANGSTASSPQTTPTPSKEEQEKKSELEKVAKDKAITDYLMKSHPGWTLQGTSSDFSSANCEEGSPCDLHLSKGKQSKVVSVMLKQFRKPDGSSYWYVFETRSVDLAQVKIRDIKDREREYTLENLTSEDCEPLNEPPDFDYDYDNYDGYDPRG